MVRVGRAQWRSHGATGEAGNGRPPLIKEFDAIGARYVVTGYSKSKRSRWGLAQAEQLSVRQPTVTETRCGKL